MSDNPHIEHVSYAESAQSRMERDIERAEDNEHLIGHLTESEEIRLATRQHAVVLWKPALIVFLITAISLNAITSDVDVGVRRFFLIVMFTAFVWGIYRYLWWRRNLFVATDKRILKAYGVFSTTVDSMRNQKVTDMSYRRNFVGEILGFGDITIESAGQDQALHDITFLPYPRENYQELCHVIFGERPREGGMKKGRFRRGIDKVAGRARRAREPRLVDDEPEIYPVKSPVQRRGEPKNSHQRMLYSSDDHRSAPTGVIPVYPPGYFDGRDDGDADEDYHSDPTRS